MLRSLFHGLYEVLDVPARVSLRVLVQLLGSPLGLLAGREARDLLLFIRLTSASSKRPRRRRCPSSVGVAVTWRRSYHCIRSAELALSGRSPPSRFHSFSTNSLRWASVRRCSFLPSAWRNSSWALSRCSSTSDRSVSSSWSTTRPCAARRR